MASKTEVAVAAPAVGKAKTFGNDAWSIWILRIGLLLILAGLIWNHFPSREKTVVQPRPKAPMNVCAGSEPVHVKWKTRRGLMPIRPECWSQTLYVPSGAKYTIEGTPGGTDVCYWFDDGCVEIVPLRNGQNLPRKVIDPSDLAMRFRGGSGIVLVELTGKNTETQ